MMEPKIVVIYDQHQARACVVRLLGRHNRFAVNHLPLIAHYRFPIRPGFKTRQGLVSSIFPSIAVATEHSDGVLTP
jgi:hypothetical protein